MTPLALPLTHLDPLPKQNPHKIPVKGYYKRLDPPPLALHLTRLNPLPKQNIRKIPVRETLKGYYKRLDPPPLDPQPSLLPPRCLIKSPPLDP